mgnify:CR=1 FL=1
MENEEIEVELPNGPDGETRLAKIWFVDRKENKLHICISDDHENTEIDKLKDRIFKLESKLNEWIQPCFCRGPGRSGPVKCLMCDTRELLGIDDDSNA